MSAALAALALLQPPRASGYALLGHSLDLARRHLRVHDNFADPGANDEITPDPRFPGADGARRALWKAALEWQSAPHLDGQGDPHQPGGLGSGGACFDPSWQGAAPGVGLPGEQVHSALAGGSGGVLAFCEVPPAGGWRIRYYEHWTWSDGPGEGLPAGEVDLQSVATHEYGHALGLGHSSEPGASMYAASIAGSTWQRSIEADDAAGLAAIYGPASAAKPRLLGAGVSGGVLTLWGTGFAPAGNEVWLTRRAAPGPADAKGAPVVVGSLASLDGGMRLVLPLPAAAGPGDALVRVPGGGHASLSNAWPVHPDQDGSTGGPPVIAAIAPAKLPCLVAGTAAVELAGSGLAAATALLLGGQELPAGTWNALDDAHLVFEPPLLAALGPVAVAVRTPLGSSAPAWLELYGPDPPALELVSTTLLSSTGARVRIAGPPGALGFLTASPDLAPSSIPGLLEAQIGKQLASLHLLWSGALPASGWLELQFPVQGLAFGTGVHFQGFIYNPITGQFPLPASPVESGVFYY